MPADDDPLDDRAPDEDALYDAYLDACLAGTAEDPATFCARHRMDAPDLRLRIEGLWATARRMRSPAADAADAADATDATDAARAAAGAEPGLPFARLGEFRLLRRLDAGGMGTVYLARQESLDRDVALKVMRPELTGSATAVERFRREALALARLRHPHIVAVHAVGEDAGVRYLAMELVPGRTLDEVVEEAAARGESLAPARVLGWGRDLARALASAHAEGVVHRDVKPSNVRITPDDRPLLLDFGIAGDLGAAGAAPADALTRTFAGSPLYAAPEQLSGAACDARVDVYGLGVTLYQALTGRVPFAGGTMDQILRRVLAEDPLPPRRLDPAIPRDAETVVLHALEKDPDRRYASAAALADDLDAVLAGRAIRARPPGAAERLRKWCRRRPVPATAAATVVVAACAAAVWIAAERRAATEDRRRQAAEKIAAARERLGAYRRDRERTAELERDAARMRQESDIRYRTAEEDAAHDAEEDALATARRARDGAVYEILDLLRAADVLDPGAPDAEALRAETFREKWREAKAARNAGDAAFFRALVARHDAAGRFSAELRGRVPVTIRSDPPGAAVRLFAEREQAEVVPGGDRRLVPVPPAGAPSPVPPGTLVLRVVRGAGGVEADDLVLALAGTPVAAAVAADGVAATEARAADGEVAATVVHDGAARETTLPPGLVVRATAAPVVLSGASVVGVTPIEGMEVAEGGHLAVLEIPGRPRVRVAFGVGDHAEVKIDVRIPRAAPDGFVYVPRQDATGAFGGAGGVWIAEREVTCAEYRAFLEDPAVAARIGASREPVLFPRSPENRHDGGYWRRDAEGRWTIPADWRPDWPVLGVSWDDAQEYARWRTAAAAAAGRREEYVLPRFDEWVAAAGAFSGRAYPFGDRFRARWVKSCFARPRASPEPVRSYPIDESPYGVFDLAGSAYEWVDGWWDEGARQRRLAGGSWAQADPMRFQVYGGTGAEAAASGGETGFRLALRIPDEDAR